MTEVKVFRPKTVRITDEYLEIVEMYSNGGRPQDIIEKLKLPDQVLESRIKWLKRNFDCVSMTQVVAHFLRKGYIK
jgi:hypothetical protein